MKFGRFTLLLTLAVVICCHAARAAEPKNTEARPRDPKSAVVKNIEEFVFLRASETDEGGLWLWVEGEQQKELVRGVESFVVAADKTTVIYQTPTTAGADYRPFALAKVHIDSALVQTPRSFLDKPPASMSDLNPVVSPTGNLIVFTRVNLKKYGTGEYDAGLWLLRLDKPRSKARLLWTSPVRHPEVIHRATVFSPDGSLLAIQRTPFTGRDIGDTLIINVAERKVLKTFRRTRIEMWLPDGRRMIASRIDPMTGRRILYAGADNEKAWKLLTPSDTSDGEPALSPDGKKLVVHTRGDYGGSTGLALVDIATGERTMLTDSGGSPQWSADGRGVFFRRRGETTDWSPEIWLLDPFERAKPRLLVKNAGRFRLLDGAPSSWADEGNF